MKRPHPGPVAEPPKTRAMSRQTQLALQAAFCQAVLAELLFAHCRDKAPDLYDAVRASEKDDSPEARRDRAWLRFYGRA